MKITFHDQNNQQNTSKHDFEITFIYLKVIVTVYLFPQQRCTTFDGIFV